MLPYVQDVRHCFAAQAGPHRLDAALHAAKLRATAPILSGLAAKDAEGRFPYAAICRRRDDLAAAEPVVRHLLDGATDVVALGTGGSSLGAQAVAQLKGWRTGAIGADVLPGGAGLHFIDNPDGITFADLLARLDLARTRFLVVSKSGGTAEPLILALAAVDALQAAGRGAHLAAHFAVVTEPTPNPTRKLAEAIGAPVLDHPTDIGGRYSVLTLVGMLPAMLMGLDPVRFREGAAAAFETVRSGPEACPPAVGAAYGVAAAEAGLHELVLMPYGDRLERFAAWWRQIWAESVGKGGQGTAASTGLGPVDQHSQLQLWLDGPNSRAFTIMHETLEGQGPRLSAGLAGRIGAGYLAGRAIGDLTGAQARATAETLARRGRPVRTIKLERLDEYAMGALFMHFQLETIVAAGLMGVDPFDQPAVEEGKQLARAYLAGSP